MTNIYNKKVLVENGTLINNWYEEEVLKKLTGIPRNIPGYHTQKKRFDGELEILNNNNPKDNTKLRAFGVDMILPYDTTSMNYGDFSSKEHKFDKIGVREKIFKEFFTSYLTNEKASKKFEQIEQKNNNNNNNYKSNEIQKIGSRHFTSSDSIKNPTLDDIKSKFSAVMINKGWLSVHKFKTYLYQLSKRKSTLIQRDDFKSYCYNYGIYFKDSEIDFIFENLEVNNSNKICLESFIKFVLVIF